jgi:VRR-NUC domain
MKESEIQKQILDYLSLKRVFHYRQNSGAFKTDAGGFYRFGTPGIPDIICVIRGKYTGIEVKAPKGKQSEHQKEFQKNLEGAGGEYILAYDLDDVIRQLPS